MVLHLLRGTPAAFGWFRLSSPLAAWKGPTILQQPVLIFFVAETCQHSALGTANLKATLSSLSCRNRVVADTLKNPYFLEVETNKDASILRG